MLEVRIKRYQEKSSTLSSIERQAERHNSNCSLEYSKTGLQRSPIVSNNMMTC